MQMHACTSVTLPQNKNEQLYKTGGARGDAWLGRISANNLFTLENARGLLKTLTITAMTNSLWSTLKNIGINLVPIRPPNPLLHPSVHDYPIKNVFSFTSRLSKENKRKEEVYLSRTVLLLTFTFSLISELSLGFAAMPVCCGVNNLFCLFWLILFLMLSSSCILFIIILICMHSRVFKRKISHSSSHPFIRRRITIPTIYLSI